MSVPIFQIDAFTNTPFAGNPAAVCLLEEPADEKWMQQVAQEMNLAITAFLYRWKDGFNLRWFTPTVEVNLCGHATLASSHMLWEMNYLQPQEQARFYTHSGLLVAERQDTWIQLDFPALSEEPVNNPPSALFKALNIPTTSYVGRTNDNYLVEVASEETVRNLKPDIALLMTLPVHSVIVTSQAVGTANTIVSRCFAPRVGIDEDPVTGSAHCSLAPFWQKRLGKNEFIAYQASARGGLLHISVHGDRVHLVGQAVMVSRGELINV